MVLKHRVQAVLIAVSLVLQASILGNGGEVFVLDMGDPVPIVHIAEELIRIHGMEPYKDIDIEFTGLRPVLIRDRAPINSDLIGALSLITPAATKRSSSPETMRISPFPNSPPSSMNSTQ